MRGYKLFRKVNGKLYPLYVLSNEEVVIGKWLPAKEGPLVNGKVKSKNGTLAYRPGWHINPDVPYETHIGKKNRDGKIAYLPSNLVRAEVEYSDKINYQCEADSNGNGWRGCLKRVPKDGYYFFKTNPNMFGKWAIAGAMRVIREMSDDEVEMLCARQGLTPLPRERRA